MSWSESQRGVAAGALSGLAITLAGLGTAALAQPLGAFDASLAGRLHLFAVAAMAPALALMVAIGRLANHRFATPEDIDGSGLTPGSARARLLQALLQNTLEQLALALPVYMAWVLLAPGQLLDLVAVAAASFLCGRVLFFWGYARGAPGRALGFGLTCYPTVLLLAGVLGLSAI